MAQNQDKQVFLEPKLCTKCTIMYGHPNFQDMCSACFKKQKPQQKPQQHKDQQNQPHKQKNLKEETPGKAQNDLDIKKRPLVIETKEEQVVGKCAKCERKTKMLGYNCKHCSKEFCRLHRLPQEHECDIDFVSLGRKQIKTDNPSIVNKKIQHI